MSATAPASTAAPVNAGTLSGFLLGCDLRYVRRDDVELVRRLDFAIRDDQWRTLRFEMVHHELQHSSDAFALHAEGFCRTRDLDLEIKYSVVGSEDAVIRASFRASALRACTFNRVGVVVLLPPAEYGGRRYSAATANGRWRSRLPRLIGPQRIDGDGIHGLFEPFTSLRVGLRNKCSIGLAFEGDEFELEDQRNWADDSFKIYSTPLIRGFPHRIEAGEEIVQVVTIRVGMTRNP